MFTPDAARAMRGSFELLEPLGRGGMGTVWLARDGAGQAVAIKTITAPDPQRVRRFRREIATLRRLRHPGVARWLEDGLDQDGLPWVAMRLVPGRPLTALWRAQGAPSAALHTTQAASHWTQRLDALRHSGALATTAPGLGDDAPLPQLVRARHTRWPDPQLQHALGWLARLCDTLAFVHGEGVVHCDLKPENIVITPRGLPVLVDFGIADHLGARVEREALESAGEPIGSALYIAPEQILGQPVDPRTDLYALGCILCEALTGATPFDAPTASQLLAMHLHAPAPRARELVEDLPEPLDALLSALLAKHPRDRPTRALEVASQLLAFATMPPPWRRAPSPRPHLHRPELVGRETLHEELREHVALAHQGSGRALLIGGESGVGKSHLASALVASARAERAMVLSGQGRAQLGGEGAPMHAFDPLLRAIADACLTGGPSRTRALLDERASALSQVAPYLLTLPGLPDQAPLPEVSAAHARRRLFEALTHTLDALAGAQPVLLVLDDLQWADALSLACLEHLVSVSETRPWAILGLYRSEATLAALTQLMRRPGVVSLRLDPLADDDARALIAQFLGAPQAPEPLASALLRLAGGNPYYIGEYLRRALDEGQLTLLPSGAWTWRAELSVTLVQPDSVSALTRERLSKLSPQARYLASALAVYDAPAPIAALGALAPEPTEQARWDALDALARGAIVTEAPPGTLRFTHERLREAALASLDDHQRRALHERVARDRALWPDAPAPGWRGYHLRHAGLHDEAHAALMADAPIALKRHAPQLGAQLLTSALDLAPSPLAASTLDQGAALLRRLWRAGAQATALIPALRALSVAARAHELPLRRAQLLTLDGELALALGDNARATRLLEEALARAEQLASGALLMSASLALANEALSRGALDLARERATRARVQAARLNDLPSEARASWRLGEVSAAGGRFVEADASLSHALAELERLDGTRHELASASLALACVRLELGDDASARALAQRARRWHRELGEPLAEARALSIQAASELERGDLTRASQRAERALAMLDTSPSLARAEALLTLARVAREQDEPATALRRLAQARAASPPDAPLCFNALLQVVRASFAPAPQAAIKLPRELPGRCRARRALQQRREVP